MSLAIDIDKTTRVLLADGWHTVDEHSFYIDSYEYLWHHEGHNSPDLVHGGGSSGICAAGFGFLDSETQELMFGPLTSILAVQANRE